NVNGAGLELKNTTSGTTTLGAINFNNAAGTYPGQIAYSSSDAMAFRVAGANLMTLNSAGVTVNGTTTTKVLTITGGADVAEPFNVSTGNGEISPGAVVVIDAQNPGKLKLSDRPYDTRVAGVISGANGISPGIQMHQQGMIEGGKNVALTGRVYVQADTSNGTIEPGDLLTTSGIPGHAMKVSDHAKAAGAILGKAMTALTEGKGMVLVLVTLQ
ncbi:MAG TPA: hypothetical protein VG347_11390, partial [Verrucomicrobiae bacterium]|nr:hypothetical protein [Verrucomicrobiae bacterium]